MKSSVILLFAVLLILSHGSMMGRADDPCNAPVFVKDQVKYCQCPVRFPNCENDECNTYCHNNFDYEQTGDATGTCKTANTCLCRFRCPT